MEWSRPWGFAHRSHSCTPSAGPLRRSSPPQRLPHQAPVPTGPYSRAVCCTGECTPWGRGGLYFNGGLSHVLGPVPYNWVDIPHTGACPLWRGCALYQGLSPRVGLYLTLRTVPYTGSRSLWCCYSPHWGPHPAEALVPYRVPYTGAWPVHRAQGELCPISAPAPYRDL